MAEAQKPSSRRGKFGALLVIIAVVIVVLVGGVYISLANTKANVEFLQSSITASPEVESGEALKNLRATEDASLTTYGWVDRDTGVVRIPIERAMDLLAERGLPTGPETPTPSS